MRILRGGALTAIMLALAITGSLAPIVWARPPEANPMHLTSPIHGTVENISASSVSVTSDKGPVGNFNIGPGTKILRDGKAIMAAQIFKGESIRVTFTVLKGVMMANEIVVGDQALGGDSGGGKKKRKNQ
jgi:hypothetical protein